MRFTQASCRICLCFTSQIDLIDKKISHRRWDADTSVPEVFSKSFPLVQFFRVPLTGIRFFHSRMSISLNIRISVSGQICTPYNMHYSIMHYKVHHIMRYCVTHHATHFLLYALLYVYTVCTYLQCALKCVIVRSSGSRMLRIYYLFCFIIFVCTII